jgi:hypothetical protein
MSRQQIERAFPTLLHSRYRITSPPEKDYNCIAWAAGDMSAWWEPDPLYICYWPDNIPRVYTVEAYVEAFETLGFTQCQGTGHEDGFEKVAIYISSDGKPAHAARQLGSGLWTSKLGNSEDIEHGGLSALEGQIYGTATVILKRRIHP